MDVKSKDGIVLFNIPFLSICIWCLIFNNSNWMVVTPYFRNHTKLKSYLEYSYFSFICDSMAHLRKCNRFEVMYHFLFIWQLGIYTKYDYILGNFKLRNWSNIIFTIDNAPFLYLFIRLLQNATLILWLRCCVDLH